MVAILLLEKTFKIVLLIMERREAALSLNKMMVYIYNQLLY